MKSIAKRQSMYVGMIALALALLFALPLAKSSASPGWPDGFNARAELESYGLPAGATAIGFFTTQNRCVNEHWDGPSELLRLQTNDAYSVIQYFRTKATAKGYLDTEMSSATSPSLIRTVSGKAIVLDVYASSETPNEMDIEISRQTNAPCR